MNGMFAMTAPLSGSVRVTRSDDDGRKQKRKRQVNSFPRVKKMDAKTSRTMSIQRDSGHGFGFSIRGGIEHGTGIFISHVTEGSDAEYKGLNVGDQIIKANHKGFIEVRHEEAVAFFSSCEKLKLTVFSMGILPGRKFAKTQVQWVDCYGNVSSPPGSRKQSPGRTSVTSNSPFNEDDERKVNVVVGGNAKLGLLIRGGSEYGLGIYVVGIDKNSVAEKCGILVGEQILEVNGISFTEIRHQVAAHIIRTCKMMTMVLKDVGKVPVSKTIYDHTEWIDEKMFKQRFQTLTKSSASQSKKTHPVFTYSLAGSQVNHESVVGPSTYGLVEEQSKYVLTSKERRIFLSKVKDYIAGGVEVEPFVLFLLDLLNTFEKLRLLGEVRGIIRPSDIDIFDAMVMREELRARISDESENGPVPGPSGYRPSPRRSPSKMYVGQTHDKRRSPRLQFSYEEHVTSNDIPHDVDRFESTSAGSRTRTPSRESDGRNGTPLSDRNDLESPESPRDDYIRKHSDISVTSVPTPDYDSPVKSPSGDTMDQSEDMNDINGEPMYAKVNKKKKNNKYAPIRMTSEDLDTLKKFFKDEDEQKSTGHQGSIESGAPHDPGESSFDEDDYEYPEGFAGQTSENSKPQEESDNENEFVVAENPLLSRNDLYIRERIPTTIDEGDENSEADSFSSSQLGLAFQFLKNEPDSVSPSPAPSSIDGMQTPSYEPPTANKSLRWTNQNTSAGSAVDSFNDRIYSNQQNSSPSTMNGNWSVEETNSHLSNGHVDDSPRKKFNGARSNRSHAFEFSNMDLNNSNPFDTGPSLEQRMSNFSINDIVRQGYLPTSSSDFESHVPPEQVPDISLDSSTHSTGGHHTKRIGKKLGSLNIQNQYQHHDYLNMPKRTPVDDPSYSRFAKPVLTKSPRADTVLQTSSAQRHHPNIYIPSPLATENIDQRPLRRISRTQSQSSASDDQSEKSDIYDRSFNVSKDSNFSFILPSSTPKQNVTPNATPIPDQKSPDEEDYDVRSSSSGVQSVIVKEKLNEESDRPGLRGHTSMANIFSGTVKDRVKAFSKN